MTWEALYLICFLFGFLLTLISFVAQHGHMHVGHAHFHLHLNHHGGDAHGGADGLLTKINFSTVTTFLAWFGGTGYVLSRYTSIWSLLALGLAALMGLGGASLMFWVISKMVKHDRTLDPADFDMIGVLGRVSSTVRTGGTGEMVFVQDGVRKATPVRGEEDVEIARGTEVVVTRYERGVAYVRRWEDLAG